MLYNINQRSNFDNLSDGSQVQYSISVYRQANPKKYVMNNSVRLLECVTNRLSMF